MSSPVLKPRPRAGQGLWFFHRLPRYQSLWFSTRPMTCFSAITTPVLNHSVQMLYTTPEGARLITCELPEDGPQLGDVSGEGDVCIEDDDLWKVGRQSFGERELHQAINSWIVFVWYPWHLRLGEWERDKHRNLWDTSKGAQQWLYQPWF